MNSQAEEWQKLSDTFQAAPAHAADQRAAYAQHDDE